MALINHGAKPILLFCKFENTSEHPTALEARENPIAQSNFKTLSVTTACFSTYSVNLFGQFQSGRSFLNHSRG